MMTTKELVCLFASSTIENKVSLVTFLVISFWAITFILRQRNSETIYVFHNQHVKTFICYGEQNTVQTK